jgi:hypothetical protein
LTERGQEEPVNFCGKDGEGEAYYIGVQNTEKGASVQR